MLDANSSVAKSRMASQPANESAAVPILPPLDLSQPSDQPQNPAGSTPRPSGALPQRSSRPDPTGGNTAPPASPSPPAQQPTHRFLSPDEWARVAHGVGAIKAGEEHHSVTHPSSWYYPPRGLPDGLYRTVITHRTNCRVMYHVLSVFRWALMVLQIILGAVLTALGSVDLRVGTPITVLAANQTVIAGLLALLHNSGLPDRYRSNEGEFAKVESHLR